MHAFSNQTKKHKKKCKMNQSNQNKSNITHLNPSKIREVLNDDKSFNSIEKVKKINLHTNPRPKCIILQEYQTIHYRYIFAEWCCVCN